MISLLEQLKDSIRAIGRIFCSNFVWYYFSYCIIIQSNSTSFEVYRPIYVCLKNNAKNNDSIHIMLCDRKNNNIYSLPQNCCLFGICVLRQIVSNCIHVCSLSRFGRIQIVIIYKIELNLNIAYTIFFYF